MQCILICLAMCFTLGMSNSSAQPPDSLQAFPDSIPGSHPNWVYGVKVEPPFLVTWDDDGVYLNGTQCWPRPQPVDVVPNPEAVAVHSLIVAAREAASLVETQDEKNDAMRQVFEGSPLVKSTWIDGNGYLQVDWNAKYGVRFGGGTGRGRGREMRKKVEPPAPGRDPREGLILGLLKDLTEDRLFFFSRLGGESVYPRREIPLILEQIAATLEAGEPTPGPLGAFFLQEILDQAGE